MSERIDAEIAKLIKSGKTPKQIQVGFNLYQELERELNPVMAADIVGDYTAVPIESPEPVTEYQDYPVFYLENEDDDYLNITT